MKPSAASHERSHIAIAFAVAVALLFAQWAGIAHRIAHAQLQQAQAHAAADRADQDGGGNAHHSCLVFDAATVGDTVHVPPVIAPLLTSARMLALWVAFISRDAPCVPCFSSRAPPRS